MLRLLFEKTGDAVWISHLDLMRVFQRAFKRAGLPLKHTQGFNPRPSVSIALPLSVGVASCCELLDFDLDGLEIGCDDIKARLNEKLVAGIRVLAVYEKGRKLRDLALLRCSITLEYDSGAPNDAQAAIGQLFVRDSLTVTKKTKNGLQEQNIIPMIRSVQVHVVDPSQLELRCLICCQNPTLNPMQIVQAVNLYLPELKPDHAVCKRLEIYDSVETIFR